MTNTSATAFDLFIIGGGINGAGIARDAAGRGLSVYLCDKGDLANGTSSASTKLIHGGLRYLEFYEFRLVREALHEREVLLNAAPHIIWPMEFILPHSPGLRSSWLVRLGLFLYDHLARRKRLSGSYSIDLQASRFGKPLKRFVKTGFVYSDCWVEDARLVVLNAVDAAQKGAQIHPQTEFVRAVRDGDQWRITVKERHAAERIITARYIVNAAGPGLEKAAARIEGTPELPHPLRLVKGSHIVVPRLYEGEHAYILQHTDRRMVFVIPFENDFTLVGTTDQPATEKDLAGPKISSFEIDYLLQAVNLYFTKQITRDDIRFDYSGIRPLFDEDTSEKEQQVSRDYRLALQDHCLSVFGGKITTFRRLAEEAVDMILDDAQQLAQKPAWTAKAILPGGDIGPSLAQFTQQAQEQYAFLPESLIVRLASHYGTRIHDLLDGIKTIQDLGTAFGSDLYAREVDFLCQQEWALDADDILLRRTKIGLHCTPETRDRLAAYLQQRAN